jgi:SOS-response transcriptional repressor LexA
MEQEAHTIKKVRPTKKQKELLSYIEAFIQAHGYSPSYREIMKALDYTSVATVSLHVCNLVKRGHLVKRDRSARSLEPVKLQDKQFAHTKKGEVKPTEERWLVEKVENLFAKVESASIVEINSLDSLNLVVEAVKLLGLDSVAQTYQPRLVELKRRTE